MCDHLATTSETRADQLLRELSPVGLLQTMLVDQIARSMGRLAQVDQAEDASDPKWVRRHTQVERSFYRALTEFRRTVKADARAAKTKSMSSTPEVRPVAAPAPIETKPRATRPDPATLLRAFRAIDRRPVRVSARAEVPKRAGHRDCLAPAIG